MSNHVSGPQVKRLRCELERRKALVTASLDMSRVLFEA